MLVTLRLYWIAASLARNTIMACRNMSPERVYHDQIDVSHNYPKNVGLYVRGKWEINSTLVKILLLNVM
jgi:hypothetical protein